MSRAVLGLLLAVLAVGLGLGAPRAPVAAQADCLTVEDFTGATIGEFPAQWKARKDAGKAVYTVREEKGKRFLHAVAKDLGIQAAKQYESWDLREYPVLAWSWRPVEFPPGADERDEKKNDSALAVYAVFPHSPVTVKSVKYVWSAVVPKDTHLTLSRGLTQVRVLESGTERRGAWVEERVNVAEDYKKYFGETEVPKPAGIAVLTDSDETKSKAQGDYANFRVCRG
jgi:Protein of unknown function (DUF3047)